MAVQPTDLLMIERDGVLHKASADNLLGAGVATGGTTGQVLAKVSATDFDTAWVDQAAGGGDGLLLAPTIPALTDLTDVALDTLTESNDVTVAGDTATVWPAVVRGDGSPEMRVNSGAWGPSGIFRAGDSLRLRLMSSGDALGATIATLHAQGVAIDWSVTTADIIAFTIESLFASGENGTWVEYRDLSTMFTDTAGTTPVTAAGDAVARVNDRSGNGRNHLQATTAQRPTYQIAPDSLVYDGVDDNMVVDFGAAFAGDVFQGTVNGVLHYAISTAGTWKNPQDARYRPDDGTVTATIAREGYLTAGDVANVKTYLREETGAGADFAGVTDMAQWFMGRTDVTAIYSGDWNTSSVDLFVRFAFDCTSLTTLDVSNWNTSSVTGFFAFVQNCTSLTTLDVSLWNTSSVTSFGRFIQNCTSLTTLDVSNWNTSSVTSFFAFALDCTSLTTLDVSNWNTSSVTSFGRFAQNCTSLTTVTVNGGTGNPFADSPCTNYVNAFINTNLTQQSIDEILVAIELAGTSTGTFNQSGGSGPSATGEAAVTALRARGWTVAVTGGF